MKRKAKATMSNMTVCQVVAVLSQKRADGREVQVQFLMDPDETFFELFADAHCREDGEPTPQDLGNNKCRFDRAMALRDAEAELRRLVEA
jgi:hypothetical protein